MAQLTKAANEPLAFSEVQAFFGRLYPTGNLIHSFALENVDGITLGTGATGGRDTGWSIGAFEFYPSQDIYIAQNPTNDSIQISRNPSQTLPVARGRLDAQIRITFISVAAPREIGIEIVEVGQTEPIRRASVTTDSAGTFIISESSDTEHEPEWASETNLQVEHILLMLVQMKSLSWM